MSFPSNIRVQLTRAQRQMRVLRPNLRLQALLSYSTVQVPPQKIYWPSPPLLKAFRFPYEAVQMKRAFYHRTLWVLSIEALPTGYPHAGEKWCSISKAHLDMSLGVPSPKSPLAHILTASASPQRAERTQLRSSASRFRHTHRSHKESSSISTAFFYPSLKVRGKGGPYRIPDGALMERSACFQSLLLHIVSPSSLPSQSSHGERRRPVSSLRYPSQ